MRIQLQFYRHELAENDELAMVEASAREGEAFKVFGRMCREFSLEIKRGGPPHYNDIFTIEGETEC